jgi:hypothetical protein
MTTKPKPSVLTPDYFAAFGAIIHHFARHEYLMQCIVSAIIDVPIVPVSILTVELGYRARRETLLSLMRSKPLPKAQLQRIETFLAILDKRNALRNAIAHQAWKQGTRPGSVRPIGISVRGGEARFKGLAKSEDEYTADKLRRIANELGRSYDRFVAYLDREGLLRYIPRNTDASNSDTSSPSGKPSAR